MLLLVITIVQPSPNRIFCAIGASPVRALAKRFKCPVSRWDGAHLPIDAMIAFIEDHHNDLGVTSRDHGKP